MAIKKPVNNILHDFLEDARDKFFGNERQSDLRQWAGRSGFSFRKRMDYEELDLSVRSFPFFRKGKRRRISNVLSREVDSLKAQVWLFDAYKEGEFGQNAVTVALLKSPLFDWPAFRIRPKRTTEKISEFFTSQPNGPGAFPAFNKTYTVQSDELDWPDLRITGKLVELIMASAAMQLQGQDGYLLVYEQGKEQPLPLMQGFYGRAVELADTLLFDHSNELV